MNKLIFISLVCLATVLCSLQSLDTPPPLTFDKMEVNFDTIQQGDIKFASFKCYNNTDTTVVFENLVSSCGCVVSQWQKTPILAKDSTIIKVKFDTKNKSGRQHRIIAIYSTQGLYELSIKAFVKTY